MQENPPTLRPLAYAALIINGLLLVFLAWHLAFEAVPAAARNFSSALLIEGRVLSLVVLLPYVLVLAYLGRKPRQRILEWRTAAALVASMVAYIALVAGISYYIVSQAAPW